MENEMTMKRWINALALLSLLVLPALVGAETWNIDPEHSTVGFKVRHMMITNVKGDFPTFSGTVEIDDKDITRSKVAVSIATASINTNISKRDEHLRSPEFFDVAKYPTMTYVSTKVEKAGVEKLRVVGNLTLHGVTREVVLDVDGPTAAAKDPWGNLRRGASATAKVNRKDFGLTWNAVIESGGALVDDEVMIEIELEMLKK
jgi:polyisoprenoid-binding protein YceI